MTLAALPTPRGIAFTHRGNYAGQEEERPVIDVEFAAVDDHGVLLGSYTTGVLVDSGARTTLLSLEAAAELGMDLSERRYPKAHIGGIVPGAGLWVAFAPVKVNLCGRWLDIPVAFHLHPTRVSHLLGRGGVFDQVEVCFRHVERAIYAT